MEALPKEEEAQAPGLSRLQTDINDELAAGGSATRIQLFRDPRGSVGVSFLGLPGDGSRRVIDTVYGRLRGILGVRRGRPRQEPTRQVKCRIPESVHARLREEARRRGTSVPQLVAELAAEAIRS